MTSIEWVRGDDGSPGISWNALRAERWIERRGNMVKVSAHHCEHVNEACRWCYADRTNPRLGGLPFKPGHRKDYTFVIDEAKLLAPLKRKKPTRYFVESMSDAFGEWWPIEFVDKLYAVMALTPWHTYVNLSKRPERRRRYLDDPLRHNSIELAAEKIVRGPEWIGGKHMLPALPFRNVIEGTSVSCQEEADEFVPILQRTKAACRVVSAEPLLGPIEFEKFHHPNWIHWIITGGESGPKARPMNPQWARDIRDQCASFCVAFFHKQNGEFVSVSEVEGAGAHFHFPDGRTVRRVGKKEAGRLLDGVEWNQFPNTESQSQSAPALQAFHQPRTGSAPT